MNFADHKKRPQQIAKLRDGGVPLIHLGRIGCSVKDLLKAGIEASELKAAGINVRRSILFHRSDSTAEGHESSGHLSGHLINDLENDGVPSDDSYSLPIKQTRKLSQVHAQAWGALT
uniref:Uncharacterized protein n=1 Tax=Florenciella parvula TaxID=236787 RepID=A0A6T7EGY7_9STRA|mmetsp:Transcript_24399/g.50410  ORF Transcript_24399/g.50410 Transcript_24399/m.50410 type:complete len:117 (+) Transcript_24399:272-622(+)